LEFREAWTPLQISLEISAEQYTTLLEYFSSYWDRGYGLIFNQMTNYFYAYRSGFILGKYKIGKQQNGKNNRLNSNRMRRNSLLVFYWFDFQSRLFLYG